MSTHQATHKHANGTEWIFARCGEDGKRDWKWTCINPDGSSTVYPASAHGWISMDMPPLIEGTNAAVFDTDHNQPFFDEWIQWNGYGTWESTNHASHWMPQSQSPS